MRKRAAGTLIYIFIGKTPDKWRAIRCFEWWPGHLLQQAAKNLPESRAPIQYRRQPDGGKDLRRRLNIKFLKFEAACTRHNGDACHQEKNQTLLLSICHHAAWPRSFVIILEVKLPCAWNKWVSAPHSDIWNVRSVFDTPVSWPQRFILKMVLQRFITKCSLCVFFVLGSGMKCKFFLQTSRIWRK